MFLLDDPAAIIERNLSSASNCACVSVEHRIGITVSFDGAFELVLKREPRDRHHRPLAFSFNFESNRSGLS